MKLANATKVGILVIGIAILAFFVYRAVEEGSAGGSTYRVYALFDDASGLVEKSRVTIAGISVGSIERIHLERGKARVDMRIRQEVPLFRDGTVQKQSVSILGQFTLAIAPGTEGLPRIPDGGEIRVATVQPLMSNVEAIAERVREIAEQVAGALGTEEGGRQLRDTLRNLAEAIAGVNRTVQANSEIVGQSLRHIEGITANAEPQIRDILANVDAITHDLRALLATPRGQEPATASNIQTTLHELSTESQTLQRTLSHAENVASSIDRGEGTVGRLVRDERLINEVQGVVEGANDFLGGIARLQTIVGLRADYNFLANTFKTYLEVRLQPREDKYYLFQVIRDPRGLTTFRNTVTCTQGAPGAPVCERSQQTITEDTFRFTFEFAKRIGFATFRFGIMESTGGLGLDLHLFHDRIEVRNDLFAFSENVFPRFRASLAYEFLEKLWILGGVDDVFNGDRTDYFLGAQLRFNDEDLKSILLFSPRIQ